MAGRRTFRMLTDSSRSPIAAYSVLFVWSVGVVLGKENISVTHDAVPTLLVILLRHKIYGGRGMEKREKIVTENSLFYRSPVAWCPNRAHTFNSWLPPALILPNSAQNWDRRSGQQKSDIYTSSPVLLTRWRGRYFLPMTTGVSKVVNLGSP